MRWLGLVLMLAATACGDKIYNGLLPTPETTPRIETFTVVPAKMELGDSARLYCRATDEDGDVLRYSYRTTSGNIDSLGGSEAIYWPDRRGDHLVACAACDASACDEAVAVVEVY